MPTNATIYLHQRPIMKIKLLAFLSAILLATSGLWAQSPPSNTITTELKAIVAKVQAKIKAGKQSEADLAPELKEFDELLGQHKNEKSDDVAQVLLMKATLYLQVLQDEAKGKELLEQLKREFPDSKFVAQLKKQEEAEKAQAHLAVGKVFPDFTETDTAGKPLSISAYKGKVVLIDFWATWCGPCVKELPNVIKAYEKHHASGFEIIGISLDQDRKKLETFVKQQNMTWPQYFDGQGWQNKLAQQYGVNSIPATYLLDREGKIIAKGLRGEKLEAAVAAALAQK